MASTIELLLLAQLSGPGTPVFAQADASGIAPGNVTTATAVTRQWAALPGTPAAPQAYEVYTEFNGTWGAQQLHLYADIAGTATLLASLGALFVPSAASGDNVNGWLKLTVRVASATACRLHLAGSINDQTLNGGVVTNGTACPISSTVTTGIAFGSADTIAISYAFAASVTGQSISTYGSTFTRLA
jgi:hypothetical protein